MLILSLDSATPWGAIALGDETEIYFEISVKSGKGGGEYLLSILNQFIAKSGKNLSEIDLIAAGTGPGSYTGIRVGLAAVQGLAEGLKVPVMGIDTLRIIAENGCHAGDWVAVVIDARRGSVYAGLYHNSDQGLKEYLPPCYTDVESFSRKLTEFTNVLVCGDGSKKYRETWIKNPLVKVGPATWDRPSAANLIRIAAQRWNPENRTILEGLNPCYLRKVEAEARLGERINADQCCSDETRRSK